MYLTARNAYFLAIKNAKRQHWNSFLEKTDPKSIFKAMAYTKQNTSGKIPNISGQDTFASKCTAFRHALFPPPPADEELPTR